MYISLKSAPQNTLVFVEGQTQKLASLPDMCSSERRQILFGVPVADDAATLVLSIPVCWKQHFIS